MNTNVPKQKRIKLDLVSNCLVAVFSVIIFHFSANQISKNYSKWLAFICRRESACLTLHTSFELDYNTGWTDFHLISYTDLHRTIADRSWMCSWCSKPTCFYSETFLCYIVFPTGVQKNGNVLVLGPSSRLFACLFERAPVCLSQHLSIIVGRPCNFSSANGHICTRVPLAKQCSRLHRRWPHRPGSGDLGWPCRCHVLNTLLVLRFALHVYTEELSQRPTTFLVKQHVLLLVYHITAFFARQHTRSHMYIQIHCKLNTLYYYPPSVCHCNNSNTSL